MEKILIVDDEPDILELLNYNLSKEGYDVYTIDNGKDALEIASKKRPDLIILDVMMSGIDGIETCRELRKLDTIKKTMIVFLTARNEDYSQIAGFDAGADDYISKPIRLRVLISRLKALLRRSLPEQTNQILGEMVIDREKYSVTIDGSVTHHFPRKEFELLSLLASKPSKVFTRHEILKTIWGSDVVIGNRTIDVHIRKLREKIGENHIQTIKGVGYKFEI
jgi:two-component system alkaline phosphatase synthesis response regulator PhoP